ncbi:MAG: nucleotidyltransferase domain-containing protein [Chloroflexi bacterium]|nr:nucleotidyltransferase domain-containing protein [Chloroflexota bacterium]
MTNYDKIARNLLKRDQREQQQIERRIEAARIEIDNLLAQFLEIDPALQKVILFGSLAKQIVKSPDFDIDLAVQCSPDRFLLLVAAALNSNFKVDVVDLASVSQAFRHLILTDGVVLYEKRRNPENT